MLTVTAMLFAAPATEGSAATAGKRLRWTAQVERRCMEWRVPGAAQNRSAIADPVVGSLREIGVKHRVAAHGAVRR